MNFQYRALTQAGKIVSGSISAPTAAEVVRQVEYLGLVPIDAVSERDPATGTGFTLDFFSKVRVEDVTIFTRDLALLLNAGARLDAALDLLSTDMDIGRLRPIVGKIHTSILAGESFAEALSRHPAAFPALYVALVIWPLLVIVPEAPVTKTPNHLPEMDAAELFVTLPPSARSIPPLPVALALMLPLFVTVPAALYLT